MGAHAALLVRAPTFILLLLLLLLTIISSFSGLVSAADVSEADVLLKFRDSLANATALNDWNAAKEVCSDDDQKESWKGVRCWNGRVWGLRLEDMGLSGTIDLDALSSIKFLRILSLMNNSFEGNVPNIKRLVGLKAIFLSHNSFSGDIASDAFAGMKYLKKVHLAHNGFTGAIPSSLTMLPRLLSLRLEDNEFEGRIPDFPQKHLTHLDLSNNMLEGPIPDGLSNLSASAFAGNMNLCGKPLDSSCVGDNSAVGGGSISGSSGGSSSKKPTSVILALIAVAIVLILVTIGLLLLVIHRNSRTIQLARISSVSTAGGQNQRGAGSPEAAAAVAAAAQSVERGSAGSEVAVHTKKADQGKLTFVRDDRERFDLHDLLRASAEVLGSGTFGSSYKAVLLSGQAMVAKRYKQMNNVAREDFQEHMRRLGRLSHPNLLPLVAYYYRKEEKLLVFDHVENGSLASHLHGNHSIDQPGLDWPTRLGIIKGVAKGLAYLYTELPSIVVPHGHLKSSNVLLRNSFDPVLTDYALLPVINSEHARQLMIAYKSPEYAKHSRTTKKTDVWALGMLILETLTGNFPTNYLTPGNNGEQGIEWVKTIARQVEVATVDVFDKEMEGREESKGTMLKLLKIGLTCCDEDMERRWDLKEAIKNIEDVQETDTAAAAAAIKDDDDEAINIAVTTENMSTITL